VQIERHQRIKNKVAAERNNSVVRDLNLLRANLGTTFGNVAAADPVGFAQFRNPIFGIERVHLERGGVNQKPKTDQSVVHLVIA